MLLSSFFAGGVHSCMQELRPKNKNSPGFDRICKPKIQLLLNNEPTRFTLLTRLF